MINQKQVLALLMEIDEELERCKQAASAGNEPLTASILSNIAVLLNTARLKVR